jgi:hypothetical protein
MVFFLLQPLVMEREIHIPNKANMFMNSLPSWFFFTDYLIVLFLWYVALVGGCVVLWRLRVAVVHSFVRVTPTFPPRVCVCVVRVRVAFALASYIQHDGLDNRAEIYHFARGGELTIKKLSPVFWSLTITMYCAVILLYVFDATLYALRSACNSGLLGLGGTHCLTASSSPGCNPKTRRSRKQATLWRRPCS